MNLINGLSRMFNNRVINFLLISIFLIVSRVYDLTTTYIYTPDLTNETNVLVKLFNIGITGLLIVQLILTAFIIYSFYIYCFKKYKLKPSSEVLSLKEFIGYFHYDKKVSSLSFLYKTPKLLSILYSVGYIVTYSLILIGFIVGTSTFFLIKSEKYKLFYGKFGPLILYTILVLIVIYFSITFYIKEYNKHGNRIKN